MDFIDPPNVKDLIKDFPRGDPREVLRYVNQVLPSWIVDFSSQFSVDLLRFNVEWAEACVKLNITPQKVILVRETFLDTQKTTHKLIKKSIEMLLASGFIVMDMHNFAKCSKCGYIIVSRERIEKFKYTFSGKCQSCFPHDPKKPLTDDLKTQEV